MYATTMTIDADDDQPVVAHRFDPRRHRRIPGLFDLWLTSGARGGLVLPTKPDRPLTARAITELVLRSGEAADDVRILTDDGARHAELFSEVAGLLAHDVLISPEGAEIRQHGGRGGPLHAVPVDREARRARDWLVIQPPDLATPLPGWFTVERGLVRPRKGVVSLPLHGGAVLATRADFVARRATAHRLGTTVGGLVTVAVTARAGGFLVGDYGGTQRVYRGDQLAALLGDLPLYGSDLRLWLTWPSDPEEQHSLGTHARELAETTGATVWTPPPGGSAELVDGRHDLRALDHAGRPAEWHAYRPPFAAGPPALRTTPTGLLVPASARLSLTVHPASPPDIEAEQTDPSPAVGSPAPPPVEPSPDTTATQPTDRIPQTAEPTEQVSADADGPTRQVSAQADEPVERVLAAAESARAGVPATPLARPALAGEDRRPPGYGLRWLSPGQQVNAERFEAFVASPVDAQTVGEGLPGAELFLLAFLDPRSVPEGRRLLRVRVDPGGAIPMSALRARLPARLQHLRGLREAYLLPAARLDRVVAVDTFTVDPAGELTSTGECVPEPLSIRCGSPARLTAGLPHEVRRWPAFGTRRAYALLPADRVRLPRHWLRLYRRQPPVTAGRLMVELRVPRGRTIDVTATADLLAPLSRVRSRAEALRAAQVELILASRSYPRVRVRRAYRAEAGAWQRVPRLDQGPLPSVLPRLQPPS
ncbi:hypothetical protein VAB18032_18505 [Micromonospora maris AB-18-032]|uniref:Uncharacterized protein n=2 Tax=Micromonospora maris TaxID=1003110 RepID=A0A9X0I011_9ACTN|nr:hypothetical protein VAB18032_18505 [Micromonospora maris AB-18-032]KUJ44279.1 hypothetical protein ADL17_13735 [Micromonospora maris]